MNNANEVQHVATQVLLNMAERAEAKASEHEARLASLPRPLSASMNNFRERTPRERQVMRDLSALWASARAFRVAAKNYREMAEQPERDEFNALRKNFEMAAEMRGCSLKIGDANPPLGEAIEMLKKISAVVQTWPVTHGPQCSDDPAASSPTPAQPCDPQPKNNCDCADCGTAEGAQ